MRIQKKTVLIVVLLIALAALALWFVLKTVTARDRKSVV